MSYSDKIDYIGIIAGIVILFLFFLLAGGGKLLDYWIDGARKKWFGLVEKMPTFLIKLLRIILPIFYIAFVVFVFLYAAE